MRCPKCDFEQPDIAVECGRCGIVFAKYREPDGYPYDPPPGPVAGSAPWVPGMAIPPAHSSSTVRPFELGDVMSTVFRLYFSNLGSFLLITAIVLLPILAFKLVMTSKGADSPGAVLIGGLMSVLGYQLATAALTYAVLQALRKRTIGLGPCLYVGVQSVLTVLFIAILQGFAIGLGVLFFLIPGLMLMASFAVTVPAAVEERTGVLGAFSRSSDLTKGYRWPVFGVLFLVAVCNIAIVAVPMVFVVVASGPPTRTGQNPVGLVNDLLSIVTTSLSATATAVIYYRLRSVKESIDIEELASVFD